MEKLEFDGKSHRHSLGLIVQFLINEFKLFLPFSIASLS